MDNFPSFPMLRSSFPYPAGRPEALRSHAAAGETQFQPDDAWRRKRREAHLPAGFPKSARWRPTFLRASASLRYKTGGVRAGSRGGQGVERRGERDANR